MPTLANALDLAKYEARNFRAHQLGTAPSSPVTGQLYYNTADNTLYWWNGTTWIAASSAAGGPPSGPAGGDLSGTYPNPGIAAGVIVDNDVNAAAAIAESKLNLATDAAAGTGSRRTIGTGALQAMAGNTRLDTIAAPTGAVSANNQKVTNLATPTATTDAANKSYVDGVAAGVSWKAPVRVVATTSIGGGGIPGGTQTIDGVTVSDGDRVLLTAQSTASANGIYVCNSVSTWSRATDADSSAELVNAAAWVSEGTTNADTGWVCTNNAPITVGSTSLTWVQFTGLGSVTAGAGLTKSANTLDIGAGAGITVNADTIQVANDGITNAMIADGAINLATADVTGTLPLTKGGTGQTTAKAARESGLLSAGYYSSATHSAGTTITITQATHGLRASRGLIVQVQDEATGAVVLPDISVASSGDVTVTFGASQAANSMRVTILG